MSACRITWATCLLAEQETAVGTKNAQDFRQNVLGEIGADVL
jgi:hypothetical protein